MIRIETLRMHLPAGFEHRAASIARLVGKSLAAKHLPGDRMLETIALRTERVALNTPDVEIANAIVEQIVAAIEGGRA